MEGGGRDDQQRATWFIVVGLALAGLSIGIAMFALVGRGDSSGSTSPASPSTSATLTTSNSPTTTLPTRTSTALGRPCLGHQPTCQYHPL